jgi:hypothetical protein
MAVLNSNQQHGVSLPLNNSSVQGFSQISPQNISQNRPKGNNMQGMASGNLINLQNTNANANANANQAVKMDTNANAYDYQAVKMERTLIPSNSPGIGLQGKPLTSPSQLSTSNTVPLPVQLSSGNTAPIVPLISPTQLTGKPAMAIQNELSQMNAINHMVSSNINPSFREDVKVKDEDLEETAEPAKKKVKLEPEEDGTIYCPKSITVTTFGGLDIQQLGPALQRIRTSKEQYGNI